LLEHHTFEKISTEIPAMENPQRRYLQIFLGLLEWYFLDHCSDTSCNAGAQCSEFRKYDPAQPHSLSHRRQDLREPAEAFTENQFEASSSIPSSHQITQRPDRLTQSSLTAPRSREVVERRLLLRETIGNKKAASENKPYAQKLPL
jgi:hypothetical protein